MQLLSIVTERLDHVAYVITQNCCKDESCVPVCPVDCIRPVGGAGQHTDTEMLYIDPEACIDCGACMDECPVDAIHYEDDLPASLSRFKEINAAYFERHPLQADTSVPARKHQPITPGQLRVAVVGAGPAACYAAGELIGIDGVEVELFEKLPTPYGLIRSGVAPDHQHTKSIADLFEPALASPRLGAYFNVEVGSDLTHDDLLAHHHAVIYAVGAHLSRDLNMPGEELPGSHAAADFVGWYNGHPDHAGHKFDLSGRRAVLIGNGNVALDVARILLMAPEHLATTDIADHALEALRANAIEEVIIIGRRGLRHAAFSVGEFLALGHLDGVDVVIEGDDDLVAAPDDDVETTLKLDIAREYAARRTTDGNKRVVFRFLTSPIETIGDRRVEGLRVTRTRSVMDDGPANDIEFIETPLVLRSIGYRGCQISGLPWDAKNGVVPNVAGRVIDEDGATVSGVYVTGWIKRGSRGVIGSNRTCAEESVAALLTDFDEGRLTRAVGSRQDVVRVMADREVDPVTWEGWRAIDATERQHGATVSRPRVKLTDIDLILATARGNPTHTGVGKPSATRET